uniref:DDE Tnp4 domain-containing protein n=1 Tax=Photinus pyralis TaxID=7054 RepID=A0A1Y1KHN8_PHOPY
MLLVLLMVHIYKLKPQKKIQESYITRKCNYAFTLQAIAIPSLQLTDVFIGYPGSVSDHRIFRNSDIYRAIINNVEQYFPENEFIIGDKAYPILNWCIPPYINRGNLTAAQVHFNTIHAQTRQVIERTFALLVGRFRRLKFLDMNRHDLIPSTVLAACVLHNICLNFNDLLIEDYVGDGLAHVVNNGNDDDAAHQLGRGQQHRDRICREVFRNQNRINE